MFAPSLVVAAILIGCTWNRSLGNLLAGDELEQGQQMFGYLAGPKSLLDMYANQPQIEFGLEQAQEPSYSSQLRNIPGYLVDLEQTEDQNDLLARRFPAAELLDVKRDLESRLALADDYNELPLSGPVNDPADFEAASDSSLASNQSVALDNLLNNYLGLLGKQSQLKDISKEVGKDVRSDHNNEPTAATDNEPAASSTASASRYGFGEYIDHPLALIGHQYVQGGAGEGHQLLGPDGSFENVQVIKSDHAVPSYCDPPNPCPIGFTSEDGCLEKFVNSASFSREYQAKQQCSCDNEHSLFNCASPVSTLSDHQLYSSPVSTTNSNLAAGDNQEGEANSMESNASKLNTLARTIQNRFGSLASVRNLISKHQERMS